MFRHVDLMQRGMDAAWKRQEVISHNIANADTPDYKAQHVEFESALRAAMSGEGGLQTSTTNERHFKIGGTPDPTRVMPAVVTDAHYTIRMDGSNVDIDHQMVQLAETYIRYSMLQTQVTSELSKLRMVIREGS